MGSLQVIKKDSDLNYMVLPLDKENVGKVYHINQINKLFFELSKVPIMTFSSVPDPVDDPNSPYTVVEVQVWLPNSAIFQDPHPIMLGLAKDQVVTLPFYKPIPTYFFWVFQKSATWVITMWT